MGYLCLKMDIFLRMGCAGGIRWMTYKMDIDFMRKNIFFDGKFVGYKNNIYICNYKYNM